MMGVTEGFLACDRGTGWDCDPALVGAVMCADLPVRPFIHRSCHNPHIQTRALGEEGAILVLGTEVQRGDAADSRSHSWAGAQSAVSRACFSLSTLVLLASVPPVTLPAPSDQVGYDYSSAS